MGLGERAMEWTFDQVMPWLMVLAVAAVVLFLVALPFIIYADMTAERFSLKKAEWSCSASVERPVTTYIQSGSVMVPMTTYTKHCTQWSERP